MPWPRPSSVFLPTAGLPPIAQSGCCRALHAAAPEVGWGTVGSGPPVAASGHDLLTCNPVLSTSPLGEGLALGPVRSLHMHFTFRLLVLACPTLLCYT